MTTSTAYGTPESKVAALRDELTSIAAADAGDPIELADDVNAWSRRDVERRTRKLALVAEIGRVEQFGELLDNPDVMGAIRTYTAATAEARTGLAYIARERAFPGDRLTNEPKRHLDTWWRELEKVGPALPVYDPDGDRWLSAELAAWFTTRDALAAAYLLRLNSRDAVELPAPELRDQPLPGGFRRGLVRPLPVQDGAA